MKNELLLSITDCSLFKQSKYDINQTCHDIVTSQKNDSLQLPEPWNGHIDTAKILFISSNPNYDPDANSEQLINNKYNHEAYPTILNNWDNEKLFNFFDNRFEWAHTHNEKPSRYWNCIFKYTAWMILGKPFTYKKPTDAENEKIYEKIAITEIVHCKSSHEIGLNDKCISECVNRHLKNILSVFNGKVIVIVGKKAKDIYNRNEQIRMLVNSKCNMPVFIHSPTSPYEKDCDKHKLLCDAYNTAYA